MMNILVTVCARAGSKGVKSKNSREFLGIPIAYYTIAAYTGFAERYGKEYDNIDFVLNTDSQLLKEQFDRCGVDYFYIAREDDLAGDRVAKADVICDTLVKMEKRTEKIYDIVLDLDITSPLRIVDDVKGCIDRLLQYEEASVAYSVTNSRRQPHFNIVLENENGFLETAIPSNYVARQEAPVSYDMNASIYAYRREPLLHTVESDVFKGKCVGWMMKDTAVLDIDSEEDYELMQVVARYFFDTDKGMKEIAMTAKKIGERA